MSESVIDSLPSELLCYILSKLDGCSLTRAGQVCQRWRVIVTALGRGFNIWYRHCLKEYGLEAVVALTGLTILLTRPGRMLAESRKELWTFWKEVYAVKQRSDCVCAGLWAVKMEKAEMWEGVVTAMTLTHPAATDMTLWSGFRSGRMTYTQLPQVPWDALKLENSIHSSSFHCDCCTGLATITLDGCPGYGIGETPPETFVVSVSIDGHVIIRDVCGFALALPRTSCQAYDISSLGPYYIVAHDGSITRGCVIMKVVRKAQQFRPTVTSVPVVKLSGLLTSNIRAVSLAYNQVVAGDDHGNVYSWDFPSLSSFDDVIGEQDKDAVSSRPVPRVTVDKPTHVIQVPFGVCQLILHCQQVLVLTEAGESNIYVINNANWQKMYVISHQKLVAVTQRYLSCIQSLAVWGSLLAVGCRSGQVLLFNISSRNWLNNLSHSLIAMFHTKMADLLVLRFSDSGRGPVLAVIGSETVIFRWRKGEVDCVTNLLHSGTVCDGAVGVESVPSGRQSPATFV